MRCACGDAVLASESDKVTLSSGNHHFSFCLGHSGATGARFEESNEDKLERCRTALQGAAEIATAMSAEQKSYRAGWEAGRRQADETVHQLRSSIENNQVVHQRFVDGLKAQFARELRLAVEAASKGAAVYTEDLDEGDDKHWLKQREDRAATKALLDKPYWAEGIDPDEP